MTKGKILGDIHQIDKDVELCRTTNERISNQAAQLLIEIGRARVGKECRSRWSPYH